MAKFGHGVGLSVEDRGGKWLLRWRQNEVQADGGVKRVQRTRMVFTLDELRTATAEIEAALRDRLVATARYRPGGRRDAAHLQRRGRGAGLDRVEGRHAGRPRTRAATSPGR